MISASAPPRGRYLQRGKMNASLPARVNFFAHEEEPVPSMSASPSDVFSSSMRLDVLIKLFREKYISLGRAVALSDLRYNEMIRKIREHEINLRFGPKNKKEAQKEEDDLKQYLEVRTTTND